MFHLKGWKDKHPEEEEELARAIYVETGETRMMCGRVFE